MVDKESQKGLIVFQDKKIRRIWHNKEWFYSVTDIIAVLINSKDEMAYWRKLKQREPQLVTICHGLKMPATETPGFVWKRQPNGSYSGDLKALLKDYDPKTDEPHPFPTPEELIEKYGLMRTKIVISGIVKHEDEYLLLKRSPNNYSPDDWEFVMGFINGEETPELAALREIKEETGLEGKIKRRHSPLEIFGKSGRYIILPFLVNVKSKKVIISEEHITYEWEKKDRLPNYKGVIKELVDILD